MTLKLISSWSGGKDSCYALIKALENPQNQLAVILNMMNENGKVSRSHAIPKAILQQHAKRLGVPLSATPATWNDYETLYIKTLQALKMQHNTDAVVFGDIDLQPHREWEEKVCAATNHQALLPLWKKDRKKLVYEMIDCGIDAIITSCNTHLGEAFLGRTIDKDLINDLEKKNVDVCGENGEYHTLVVNCPLFKQPIDLPSYTKTTHENYCFLNWQTH